MRSIEEKGCYNNHGQVETISSSSGAISFEFHKGNGTSNRVSHHHHHHHRTSLGKPTPSKWDDAQKWLVGLSRGGAEKNQSKPRNSNADDRRLITPAPIKEQDYSSDDDAEGEEGKDVVTGQYEVETKTVDCDDSIWRINKQVENTSSSGVIRSVCVRDMGTEMTPIASQEPSRTATPIRATSPITSGSSTPIRCQNGSQNSQSHQMGVVYMGRSGDVSNGSKVVENKNCSDQVRKMNNLESRAQAWDEAEQAKFMARYKREEVKIQAWENHQKRKAEMEMKKMEVKAERMKSRAQEKFTNKLASTRRIAEEKRANAEARLNENNVRTSERADYIRRTGHMPSSFSFKFPKPSFCW